MLRRVVIWGTFLYALGLLALTLLWRVGVDVWWVALPSIVGPFLFLPVVALAPLGFWVRKGRYLISVGLLALLFVVSYGGLFLPRAPIPTDLTGTPLRVMTFNHLYLNRDLGNIKTATLRGNADIVALQELTPEVAEGLRRDLRGHYPYTDLRPAVQPTRTDGIGLLSRFPLTDTRYDEAYGGQRVTVRVRRRDVALINLHLNLPFAERASDRFLAYSAQRRDPQLGALERAVTSHTGPFLVLGDFNLSDREPDYRRLERLMTDVYRRTRTGFGFTYPALGAFRGVPVPPLVRLDYVWVRGLEPVTAFRDCRTGSDHCLVVADVRLP